MECKESSKGGVVDGEAASDPLYKGVSYVRNSGEEVGNDCGTSE